jgi:hypothetical protein
LRQNLDGSFISDPTESLDCVGPGIQFRIFAQFKKRLVCPLVADLSQRLGSTKPEAGVLILEQRDQGINRSVVSDVSKCAHGPILNDELRVI